jgi:hypothetical protein
MGMFGIHLRAANGLDHDAGGIGRASGPACRGDQPVLVIRRHQHEFPAAVTGDLDGFALCLMLVCAEVALEFDGGGFGHGSVRTTAYLYYMNLWG